MARYLSQRTRASFALLCRQRDASTDDNESERRTQASGRDAVNASSDDGRCFVHSVTFLEESHSLDGPRSAGVNPLSFAYPPLPSTCGFRSMRGGRGIRTSEFLQSVCSRMRPINGVHKGDLRLSGDLTLTGQIRGTVWVMSGTTFDCRGQVVGDVVVEYGGTAVVRGMVVGKILNAGGTVDLFGMVAAVNDSENSRTIVHPGAVITGN